MYPKFLLIVKQKCIMNEGLQNVFFEEGITELSIFAFNGNKNITSIELPSTIKKLSLSSLSNLTNLEYLYPVIHLLSAQDYAKHSFHLYYGMQESSVLTNRMHNICCHQYS